MTGRRHLAAIALGLAGLVAVPVAAVGDGESGAGNGYVLMVHGWFEPYPEGQPHAAGVITAERDGGMHARHVLDLVEVVTLDATAPDRTRLRGRV